MRENWHKMVICAFYSVGKNKCRATSGERKMFTTKLADLLSSCSFHHWG